VVYDRSRFGPAGPDRALRADLTLRGHVDRLSVSLQLRSAAFAASASTKRTVARAITWIG